MLRWGLDEASPVDRPETTEDAKQRALPTTIGPRDQEVHTLFNLQRAQQQSTNINSTHTHTQRLWDAQINTLNTHVCFLHPVEGAQGNSYQSSTKSSPADLGATRCIGVRSVSVKRAASSSVPVANQYFALRYIQHSIHHISYQMKFLHY